MGRKATFYLLHLIMVVMTFILSVLLILGFFAFREEGNAFLWALSMGLMLLVVLNAVLVVYWAVKKRIWFVVPLVAIVLNFNFIGSMIQLRNVDKTDCELKIATYNIHGFRHGEYAQVMTEIAHELIMENASVVCMQEFVLNKKYSFSEMKSLMGAYRYGYLPTDGNYNPGVAIFSKYPIINVGYMPFEDTDNSALWADIDVKGKIIRVINAHLQTTNLSQSGYELAELKNGAFVDSLKIKTFNTLKNRLMNNEERRIFQAEKILSVADTTKTPVILCGDWNTTPASYIYSRMTENYTDGFKECGGGYGYTFNSFLKMLRIDFVLYKGIIGKCYYSPKMPYSDHNPVLFGFSLGN
ncbi:MAG: endonuclease/exonuclease/phosphatase family protein [Flavobacteriales bacterium]|nr:endonuclease/exonuclease/phosphatase family protein [Flavobacteriales bacterium]